MLVGLETNEVLSLILLLAEKIKDYVPSLGIKKVQKT